MPRTAAQKIERHATDEKKPRFGGSSAFVRETNPGHVFFRDRRIVPLVAVVVKGVVGAVVKGVVGTGGRGRRGALQKDRKLRQNGLTMKRSRGVSGCYSAISCPFTGEWRKKKMLVKGVSCALAGFSGGGAGRWSADERKWLKSVFSRIGRNCRFPQSRGN